MIRYTSHESIYQREGGTFVYFHIPSTIDALVRNSFVPETLNVVVSELCAMLTEKSTPACYVPNLSDLNSSDSSSWLGRLPDAALDMSF
jgi:hypothetical protein